MSPLLKKVAPAVAVKELVEKIAEARRPKRSLVSRMSPLVLVGAAGAGAFYLYRSGKLDQVMGKVNSSSPNETSAA